ncbi:MAG: hypothetical protein M3Q56_11545 [Bacteroidota bacterium]|nr:hypothetical protein [Bacteroidota bacterium]
MKIKTKLFIVFGVFVLTGCGLCSEEDYTLCKPENHKNLTVNLETPVTTALPGGTYKSSLEGNERVFIWTRRIDNVCTLSDAKLKITVNTFSPKAPSVILLGYHRVVSQSIQIVISEQSGNSLILSGNTSQNLEPIYSTGPGWYEGILQIRIPTTGSLEQDEDVLIRIVKTISLNFEYFQF